MRRKLLLATVSALLTLLVGEAALRLLGYGAGGRGTSWYAGGNHPRFLFQPSPDPDQGYTLRPSFRGWQVAPGREFAVPAVINAQGLRDHPHTAPPRPLVLAIGDSMTFGEGVPVERTFAALLERSTGARVVNAGVPGYGSPQMLARFKQVSTSLQPDLVLVTLSPLWDRNRCAEPFVYKEGFLVAQGYAGRLFLIDGNLELGEVRWPLIGPATAWAKGHSALARLALPALRDLLTHRSPARGGAGAGSAAGVEPTARALAALQAAARRKGAEIRVVLIESRGPDHQADRRALEQALRRRGIPVTALDRLLANADWQRLRYPRDQHWNAAGHRAVAAALAPLVREAVQPQPEQPRVPLRRFEHRLIGRGELREEPVRRRPLPPVALPEQHVIDRPAGAHRVAKRIDHRRLDLQRPQDRTLPKRVHLRPVHHGEVVLIGLVERQRNEQPLRRRPGVRMQERPGPERQRPAVRRLALWSEGDRQQRTPGGDPAGSAPVLFQVGLEPGIAQAGESEQGERNGRRGGLNPPPRARRPGERREPEK